MGKVILVTGCSSGIGKATAERLGRAGHTVYATARKVSAVEGIAGCRPLALDVNDEASMVAAVAAVEQEHGAVDVLVNNAGYSQSGALETLPIDAVRKQFETNVFGLLRLTQLVLPKMRERRRGRIVNVSSMGGTFTFPGGGAYHATKYAVEALSDALRFELAGFGIQVVIIQPGIIKTGFADAVAAHMGGRVTEGPYASFDSAVELATQKAYTTGPLGKLGGGPDDVAVVIERAIEADSPRARYPVTWSATVMMKTRRWLSDSGWDAFCASAFPRPGAT